MYIVHDWFAVKYTNLLERMDANKIGVFSPKEFWIYIHIYIN